MSVKKIPDFHYKNCVNCGICVQACPVSAITMTKKGKRGKYRNMFPELVGDSCIGCSACAGSCPMECIAMMSVYEG